MHDENSLPGAESDPGKVNPYLPIEQHGIIGDRRTAALVAADGTLDGLCLPDFAGACSPVVDRATELS